MPTPIPIILLKTPLTPHSSDPYTSHFPPPTYHPTFVPPLHHTLHPPSPSTLTTLPSTHGGLILTSARATLSLSHTLSALPLTVLPSLKIPLYVVGPATAAALEPIRNAYLPHCSILGRETGNAEALAALILQHYNALHPATSDAEDKPPLLFLAGEKRRDVLPRLLMHSPPSPGARIRVDEMVVYATSLHPEFASAIQRTLLIITTTTPLTNNNNNLQPPQHQWRWIVFFSGEGAKEVFTALGWLGDEGRVEEGRMEGRRTFVAVIGEGTRGALEAGVGWGGDVVAKWPGAGGVREAVEGFMAKNGSGEEG